MGRRARDKMALSVIWDPLMILLGIIIYKVFITYKVFLYGLLTKPS